MHAQPERLQRLGSFFKLGLSQFLLTIGAFFFATLFAGPALLSATEIVIPLDDAILRPIFTQLARGHRLLH